MAEGAGLVVANGLSADNWDELLMYIHAARRPLKIGYKSEVSVQNLIFEQALLKSDIAFSHDPDDEKAQVLLVNLNGADNLIPALENDLIDGFVIMQPFLALAQTQGVGKMIALLRDMPPKGRWHGQPATHSPRLSRKSPRPCLP